MTYYRKQAFLMYACLLLTSCSIAPEQSTLSTTLYHQINPELLKKVTIENSSQADKQLITACQLTEQFGLKLAPINDTTWQAITSVEMITQVLPRLHRTHTTFGYTALVQQCAQMSTDLNKLQRKTNLLQYFETNQKDFTQLNAIIKHSALAEAKFLEMCTMHNEEEQLSIDTINKKFYYTSWLGSYLNENSYALGFWTRSNQLHTLAWYTLPTLLAVNSEKTQRIILKANKENELYFTLSPEEQEKLINEIKILEKQIQEDPTFAKKAYTDLINDIKKIDSSKQTDFEKIILQTPVANFLLNFTLFWKNYKHEAIKYTLLFSYYLNKYFIFDGVANAPAYYKKIAKNKAENIKYHIDQNPFYNEIKEQLVDNGWEKNNITTKSLATTLTTGAYAVKVGLDLIYPYILFKRYKATKELFDLVYEKQQALVQVSHLIQAIQKVHNILNSNEQIKALIPEHELLTELFDQSNKKTSSDLKNLINALLSSSFTQDTYYLSQQGKILAVHHLLMRVKHELIPYLQAYGHIDAYLSTYKLYAEFKNHPSARICMPEFIQHDTPQLIAESFWHPLIAPNKVVTNSISLGTNTQNTNLIITGPNAGGKTTSLTSLIINIIMAQSFGIAPSARLVLTPFDKIHSYLDITTNLIEGESLFKAEVNRAKKLKESILSCSLGEKTFTIIDEIFSGTNPDVASKVGFTFAEQIGQVNHSMSIITTHFPRLTDLETETTRYTNYKVADAHIAQDGSVTYPFKLVKGKSSQNIAQHMLEHEGII